MEKLVESSATFTKKTEYDIAVFLIAWLQLILLICPRFSQEKYLKKKRQKHQPLLRVEKPTARLLCQLTYERYTAKILFVCVIKLLKPPFLFFN